MKFTIEYKNPMAAVTQDYRDPEDAIAHVDTENNDFCRIYGGNSANSGAVFHRGIGWRMIDNRMMSNGA